MVEKLNKKEILSMAEKFSCLGHTLRFSIVQLLHQHGTLNVTQIYNMLQVSQPIASFHLNILRENKIVNVNRKGKNVFYSLNYDTIDCLLKCISFCK